MPPRTRRYRLGASWVIAVGGEIRGESALRDGLSHAAEESTSPDVILDLSEATVLDPDAVPALVDAYWRITTGGGRFSLVIADNRVRSALTSTSLDWLIPIYDSTHAAATHQL